MATAAPSAVAPVGGEPGDADGTGRVRRFVLAGSVLALVVLGLLITGAILLGAEHAAWRDRARGDAAVAAARDVVVRLSSLSQDALPEQIDGLLQRSTGPFRAQLSGTANLFGALAGRAQFRSQGEITSAALETEDGNQATVLVTSTSRVANTATPGEVPRRYRLALTLQWDGEQWLVDTVEQVA